MKCVFCGMDTKEKHEQNNVVIISHRLCLIDRMEQLAMDDIGEILRYEQEIIRRSSVR